MDAGNRLDGLFTPDRLRQNWQNPSPPAPVETPLALNCRIRATYQELVQLIGRDFPDSNRLTARLDELAETINGTFPLDTVAAVADVKQKAAIVEMLEQLEALLWAMGLPQKGDT